MELDRITIAITQMDAMVAFYNGLFDAGLQPLEPMNGFQFYGGKLAGIDLLFCPNEIAGVVAEQNRHQFRFVVDDVDALRLKASQLGGGMLDDGRVTTTSKSGSVSDPEGNTIEFIQAL
jgi:predicted enzyme related to lactoylglutathione lyase